MTFTECLVIRPEISPDASSSSPGPSRVQKCGLDNAVYIAARQQGISNAANTAAHKVVPR